MKFLSFTTSKKWLPVVVLVPLLAVMTLTAFAEDNQQEEGEIAMYFIAAAERGNLAVVKELLAEGADVNGRNRLQQRALPCAAANGNIEVVKLLLEKGADIEATDQDCLTPLMNACERGHLEIVRLLLDKGADINAQTKAGSTALRKAVNEQYIEVVRLLLKRGADVHDKLNDGTYILMSAAMTGNTEILNAILDKGADVNARDDKGSSALTWAAVMESKEVVKLLKSRGAESDLSVAALTGDRVEVQRLLDAGADANAVDGLGSTPLMYAAQKRHAAVVELLLERGADPAKHVKGRTAYDRGLSRVLGTLFLKKGMGILPKGSAQMVLVSACYQGRIDVVKQLLANGVDVNEGLPDGYTLGVRINPPFTSRYAQGFTPLMSACAGGRIAVAKVLLDNGADVSQTDAKGYTALIHAAVNGELSAIKFLLANGVDIDQRSTYCDTALILATSRGEMESVKFLLANGADVNAGDENGITALNMNCYGPIRDLLKAHGGKALRGGGICGTPPLF